MTPTDYQIPLELSLTYREHLQFAGFCQYFESTEGIVPNAKTHARIGMLTGGAAALYYTPAGAPAWQVMVEAAGGVLGGRIGARLPDVIDPPTSPNHRAIAHGVVPSCYVASLVIPRVTPWQDHMRQQAAEAFARAEQLQPGLDRVLEQLKGVACTFVSGMIPGFVGGYASHLVLDGCTPSELPILGLKSGGDDATFW